MQDAVRETGETSSLAAKEHVSKHLSFFTSEKFNDPQLALIGKSLVICGLEARDVEKVRKFWWFMFIIITIIFVVVVAVVSFLFYRLETEELQKTHRETFLQDFQRRDWSLPWLCWVILH